MAIPFTGFTETRSHSRESVSGKPHTAEHCKHWAWLPRGGYSETATWQSLWLIQQSPITHSESMGQQFRQVTVRTETMLHYPGASARSLKGQEWKAGGNFARMPGAKAVYWPRPHSSLCWLLLRVSSHRLLWTFLEMVATFRYSTPQRVKQNLSFFMTYP